MKLTGFLITDQIRDVFWKLQGHTVFPVTVTPYSITCPLLPMPPSFTVFLEAFLNGPSPTRAAAWPFCHSESSSCGRKSCGSGRKDNGYVGGSMFDSYRLSSEARPWWFGSAVRICAVGLFFFFLSLSASHDFTLCLINDSNSMATH